MPFPHPKAKQLTAFEQQAHDFDVSLTPIGVEINGTVYQAGGTHAGKTLIQFQEGGRAQNNEAHFTISKEELPVEPALNSRVHVGEYIPADGANPARLENPEELTVILVSGHDAWMPVWSVRAQKWNG